MTPQPLRDLLVVDLTRHLPGPLAARLLADLGARVVKIEEPRQGDPVRAAPPLVDGAGTLGTLLLAGLDSVALDLERAEAREVLLGLLGKADVLLESFRPGRLERFGLAPEELRRRFPRLVVCSLSGWGQEGPHAARAGHDLTYEAIGGALAPTGTMPNAPIADLVGGWSAVAAVLAALHARERDGAGVWIDQALVDAAVHANVTGWASEAAAPRATGETLPLTGALPCYNLYRTRDGALLAVACLEPHFWRRFCEVAGRPRLARLQLASGERARKRVARLIASRTRAEWEALLAREDLPIEPVLAMGEALRHPQVAAREVVRRGADGLLRLGFPAKIDGVRPRAGERLAEVGEDTTAVLAAHGLDAGRSPRQLRAQGIGRVAARVGLLRRWLGRRG